MKSNGLRIGNVLTHGKQFVKVNCIFPDHFTCIDSDGIYRGDSGLGNFTPTLLTERRLKDFGFKRVGYNEDGNDIYKHDLDGEELLVIRKEKGFFLYQYEIEIRYVHHLQNLYFDLAGEELTKII